MLVGETTVVLRIVRDCHLLRLTKLCCPLVDKGGTVLLGDDLELHVAREGSWSFINIVLVYLACDFKSLRWAYRLLITKV